MHTYTEIMGQGGIDRIIQRHTRRGRRRVMPDQPDYLAAKAEEGQPRIKVAEYVAPKPKPIPVIKDKVKEYLRAYDATVSLGEEDLIDLLIAKGVIQFADLADKRKEKIQHKRNIRKLIRGIFRTTEDNKYHLPECTHATEPGEDNTAQELAEAGAWACHVCKAPDWREVL